MHGADALRLVQVRDAQVHDVLGLRHLDEVRQHGADVDAAVDVDPRAEVAVDRVPDDETDARARLLFDVRHRRLQRGGVALHVEHAVAAAVARLHGVEERYVADARAVYPQSLELRVLDAVFVVEDDDLERLDATVFVAARKRRARCDVRGDEAR